MDTLDAVLKHLKEERQRIDRAIAALEGIGGKSLTEPTHRRNLSAAARKRIADAFHLFL